MIASPTRTIGRAAKRDASAAPPRALRNSVMEARKHPNPGLERVEAQDDLQVERDREEDPHQDQVLGEKHREPALEVGNLEQPEMDERVLVTALAATLPGTEERQHTQPGGDRKGCQRKPEWLDWRVPGQQPAPVGGLEQTEHDQCQSQCGQHGSDPVEPWCPLAWRLGDQPDPEQNQQHERDLADEDQAR